MSLDLTDNQAARDAFQFAYEEITEDSYRCPHCGWTMIPGKYGYSCHSTHCTDTIPELTDEMKLDASTGDLTELMKQEGIITPLEQDILNTWAELLKHPLDMSSANEKIVSNNLKYPDIYTKVSVLPSTVQKPVQEITETDLRYILDSQLTFLVQKEQEAHRNGQ